MRERSIFGVSFCLLAVFASDRLAIADVPARGSITLEVIQCAEGRAEAPQLSIAPASEYPNLHYTDTDQATTRRLADGYYEVTDAVPQGNYFYQLRSSHCSNYLQDAVLGGHKRILSIALHPNPTVGQLYVRLVDSENAVAGALAVHPDVGWLVAANGATRVLDIQDGAYYIERVEPGQYSLRFELHGSLQSEIPVDLSELTSKQLYERDVDISTFRKNLGAILRNGTLKDCGYCY